MEENNDALINLCKIRLMLHRIKAEISDTSKRKVFQSFIARNWSTSNIESKNMVSVGSSKKRALEKVGLNQFLIAITRKKFLNYHYFDLKAKFFCSFSGNHDFKARSKIVLLHISSCSLLFERSIQKRKQSHS